MCQFVSTLVFLKLEKREAIYTGTLYTILFLFANDIIYKLNYKVI